MIDLLAHRANVEGPAPANENSLAVTRRALELGFGIETDLRRDSQKRLFPRDSLLDLSILSACHTALCLLICWLAGMIWNLKFIKSVRY